MYTPEFDPNKMRETVLQVASRRPDPEPCDTDHIGLMLYFADTEAYRRLGSSITGATYRNMSPGPMPAQLPETLLQMMSQGDAQLHQVATIVRITTRISPNREPNLSTFTAAELDIIESTMESFQECSTEHLSKQASTEVGYRTTKPYSTIPYETSWISTEPLSPKAVAVGKRVAAGQA